MNKSNITATHSSWNGIYRIGAVAALIVLVVGIAETLITFLPGGERTSLEVSVLDWFALYQDNWFMGLRNLGLLNIFLTVLGVPVFLALYGAHRHSGQKAYAALAAVLYCIGVGVYLAGNTAFPMFTLSQQYANATSEAQRTMIAAAGQAMLAVGKSHSPGTFMAFLFSEIAGLTISLVMLRGRVFGRTAALVGIVGFVVLIIFDVCSAFIPALFDAAIFLVMFGGPMSILWYILIARRLFQLARSETQI